MTQPYYFDVLPYHPPPEPFESLTGYLIRLADGNGVHTVRGSVATCFPGKRWSYLYFPADRPPTCWETLPTVSVCSETILRATTFYHLAEKLGCPLRPQAISIFLRGSIADHFRYCPHCLVEQGYHVLPWRFLGLDGCADHDCRLLDRCGHCGQRLPLLMPAPLHVCIHCRGDLRLCQSVPLTEAEKEQAAKQRQALEFLLSPEPVAGPEAAKHLGQRLIYWRLNRGVTSEVMAQELGIPKRSLNGLERGLRQSGTGLNFQRYEQYVAYFGLSWSEIFATPLPPDIDTQKRQAKLEAYQCLEQELIEKVQAALEALGEEDELLTQKAIAQNVGWPLRKLRSYPRVKAILDQAVAERKRRRQEHQNQIEKALVELVEAAIDQLEAANQPVSQKAIAKMAGPMRLDRLLAYPLIRAIFEQQGIPRDYPESSAYRQREAELVEAVQAAIVQLKTEGQAVTQGAIARIVGMTIAGLKKYLRVRTILQQVVEERYRPPRQVDQDREQKLVAQVQAAAQQLASRGRPFTQKELAALTDLSLNSLQRYPRVRMLLAEIAQQQRQLRVLKVQQQVETLLVKVQQAIETLKQSEHPLTQKKIAEVVGYSKLSRYPQIKALMIQATQKSRQD
jgi:transcriptional regulator with XRE-family HTH domain